MADVDELQSVGSADDRSRQSSLASLADDLTKRSTYSHRLGLGLDRALQNLHHAPAGAGAGATSSSSAPDSQFLSTAAAVATGTASGFGSFRVPIQTEESRKRLSSLAEAAGDDAEEEQPPAPSDAPMLQVCIVWQLVSRVRSLSGEGVHVIRPFSYVLKHTKKNDVHARITRRHACALETHRH